MPYNFVLFFRFFSELIQTEVHHVRTLKIMQKVRWSLVIAIMSLTFSLCLVNTVISDKQTAGHDKLFVVADLVSRWGDLLEM